MTDETVILERAQSILKDLITQRRILRRSGADKDVLEANRLGIVYWQGKVIAGSPGRVTLAGAFDLSTESTSSTAARQPTRSPR